MDIQQMIDTLETAVAAYEYPHAEQDHEIAAMMKALNKVYVAAIRVSDKAMLTEGGIGALDELQKGDLWNAIAEVKALTDSGSQDSAIVDYSDCDFDDSSQELVGEDENCVRFNPNGTATNFGKPIIDTTADSKRKQCRHGLILYGDRCLNCEREDAVAESGHGS